MIVTTIDAGVVILFEGEPTQIRSSQLVDIFDVRSPGQVVGGPGVLEITDVRNQVVALMVGNRIELKDVSGQRRSDTIASKSFAFLKLIEILKPSVVGVNLQLEADVGMVVAPRIADKYISSQLTGQFGPLLGGAVHFSYPTKNNGTVNIQFEPRARQLDSTKAYVNTNISYDMAKKSITEKRLLSMVSEGFSIGEDVASKLIDSIIA